MTFAIIETGGKQYLVSPKNRLKIEKLSAAADGEVVFDKVLLVSDNQTLKIGKPYLSDVKVTGKVLKHGRARKIRILKYKPKVRYRRRLGHRQHFTLLEITDIKPA